MRAAFLSALLPSISYPSRSRDLWMSKECLLFSYPDCLLPYSLPWHFRMPRAFPYRGTFCLAFFIAMAHSSFHSVFLFLPFSQLFLVKLFHVSLLLFLIPFPLVRIQERQAIGVPSRKICCALEEKRKRERKEK